MYLTDEQVAAAEKLGWNHDRDTHRGSFLKRKNQRIWAFIGGWQTARIVDSRYADHKPFKKFEDAMRRTYG